MNLFKGAGNSDLRLTKLSVEELWSLRKQIRGELKRRGAAQWRIIHQKKQGRKRVANEDKIIAYRLDRHTLIETAKEFGIAKNTVRSILARHDIQAQTIKQGTRVKEMVLEFTRSHSIEETLEKFPNISWDKLRRWFRESGLKVPKKPRIKSRPCDLNEVSIQGLVGPEHGNLNGVLELPGGHAESFKMGVGGFDCTNSLKI